MIELENVHKELSGRQILNGLSLSIGAGETLAILGRSGIGKSVTLRHIVGLMKPDSGRVRVLGSDVNNLVGHALLQHRRRIGYLFQDGALLNWMTLAENVGLPLVEHERISRQEVKDRVHEVLSLVELETHKEKYPSQISGGMRKRAGLARALVNRPEIVLYDEPTSGLDPISSSLINRLVRDLRERLGITQVVVTHDMSSAYQIGDRLALLHNGKIRAIGTPEEIQASPDRAVQQFILGQVEGPLSRDQRHQIKDSHTTPEPPTPHAETPAEGRSEA
jgi:phospholipid/cholesterol/gamma-HCH transport system ATP-binding protein